MIFNGKNSILFSRCSFFIGLLYYKFFQNKLYDLRSVRARMRTRERVCVREI